MVVVIVGVTLVAFPVVATEPPQEIIPVPVAPGLKLPPDKVRVVAPPGHIAGGVPVADVAETEFAFTVTVTEALLLTQEGE